MIIIKHSLARSITQPWLVFVQKKCRTMLFESCPPNITNLYKKCITSLEYCSFIMFDFLSRVACKQKLDLVWKKNAWTDCYTMFVQIKNCDWCRRKMIVGDQLLKGVTRLYAMWYTCIWLTWAGSSQLCVTLLYEDLISHIL